MNYWISCPRFTIKVQTDSQKRIVHAAPLARKFIGQPVSNLTTWCRKFGQVNIEKWHSKS